MIAKRSRALGIKPQFRFDDAHTGANPFEQTLGPANVRRLQLDWAGQLGDLVDYSSPAVVGGIVYIGSSDGRLWAWPRDGCGKSLCTKPLWRSVSLAQIVDSPTVVDGVVYIGSQTSPNSNDGRLNAFAAGGCGQAECAPLWQGTPLGDQEAPFAPLWLLLRQVGSMCRSSSRTVPLTPTPSGILPGAYRTGRAAA